MIADFVIDKMNSYIIGRMKPDTAGKFTREELASIYLGRHYSRDAGKLQKTPPPENLGFEAAMEKTDALIAEILKRHA